MRGVLLRLMAMSVMAILLVGASPPVKTVIIDVTDDAYVVADFADPGDAQLIRDRNLGNQDFTRTWYAWKVLGSEQVISGSLFKFPLDEIRGKKVASAHLQLYATGITLKPPARLVDVTIAEGTWSEATVTYNTRPTWQANPISTNAIYGPNVWYSWDVTSAVAAQAVRGGSVSFVASLRAIDENSEEQVLFASRETGVHVPRLVVTYDASGEIPVMLIAAGGGGVVVLLLAAFFVGRSMARRGRRVPPTVPTEPSSEGPAA